MKVEPARQYARWFEEQGNALRDNLERAQNRLSEYQQKKGIVVNDERLDNETATLNELSTQLTIVQGQIADAGSKQRSGSAGDTLPEVVQNPLIRNLKAEIARLEGKELSGNLGRNHPSISVRNPKLLRSNRNWRRRRGRSPVVFRPPELSARIRKPSCAPRSRRNGEKSSSSKVNALTLPY